MYLNKKEIDTFPTVKAKLSKYQLAKPILMIVLALGSAIGCAAAVAFIFVTLRVFQIFFILFCFIINSQFKIHNLRCAIKNESKSWFLVFRWIRLKLIQT